MSWVLIYFVAAMQEPAVIGTYDNRSHCTSALTVTRMIENELRAPFSHFCLPKSEYDDYLMRRRVQELELWRQVRPPPDQPGMDEPEGSLAP